MGVRGLVTPGCACVNKCVNKKAVCVLVPTHKKGPHAWLFTIRSPALALARKFSLFKILVMYP